MENFFKILNFYYALNQVFNFLNGKLLFLLIK
jgi:hypothetical protein